MAESTKHDCELNHQEALEIACIQKEASNLARCYLDLVQQLAESESWKTLLCQMRRIDHLAKQLAKREKQVVMLREAIEVCHGVTGYEFKLRKEALDATADLSGSILCDAEPVGYGWFENNDMKALAFSDVEFTPKYSPEAVKYPLYKAKEIGE
jgi:hypothetical protein